MRTSVDLVQPPPHSLVPPLRVFLRQDRPASERNVRGKKSTLIALSHRTPHSCHPPVTSHSIHIKATPPKLWSHCCLQAKLSTDVHPHLPTPPPPPPRLRLMAALSVCRGVLENTNRSLMKCLQKVAGWRRRRGREPTTEKEGDEGVKERETERSEGKSITQIQLSEAMWS